MLLFYACDLQNLRGYVDVGGGLHSTEDFFSPYEATILAPSGSSENHNNPQHYFSIPPRPYPRPISSGQPADREAIVPSNLEATVATVSP